MSDNRLEFVIEVDANRANASIKTVNANLSRMEVAAANSTPLSRNVRIIRSSALRRAVRPPRAPVPAGRAISPQRQQSCRWSAATSGL